MDGKAKITDFGSVKKFYETTYFVLFLKEEVEAGTHGFLGPEPKKKGNDFRSGDIYAIGGVLVYLFAEMFPFEKEYEDSEDAHNDHIFANCMTLGKDFYPEFELDTVLKYFKSQNVYSAGEYMIELIQKYENKSI
jgi:serine/threonine protein kinase